MKKRLAQFQQYLVHEMELEGTDSDQMMSEALSWIGVVVWYFNTLEKMLDSAICQSISEHTDSLGLLVIHGMPYGQKVELYRRLCEVLHATVGGPVPSFSCLADKLKAVALSRNLVVHADWSSSDADGYAFTKMIFKKGNMVQEYAQLTPEAMEKVADEIMGAKKQFEAYLEERDELLRDKRHDKPALAQG